MLIKIGAHRLKLPPLARFARIPLTIRLRNLPIYLAYNIVPLIAAACIFIGRPQPEYDILWGAMLLLLIFSHRSSFSKWAYYALRIILLMVFLKYVLPLCWTRNVSFKALAIDFKWIYYLIWSILWINFAGKIDMPVLYRCGRNLALGYCMFVIVRMILLGGYSRLCTYLFGECNYVCYLILIPYCFIRQMRGSLLDHFIFLMAVFLSDSRTGLASAVVITAYPFYMASRHKGRYWVCAIVFATIYVRLLFVNRGHDNIENVDRVMFLMQFLNCLKSFNVFDIFLGLYPGTSIPIYRMVNGFAWHIDVFEKMHGLTGCYPFYFHSTYIRLFMVWGIPIVTWLLAWVTRLFNNTKSISMKRLVILFLMESVSLSTLSLTNVSVIFFLTAITLLLNHGGTAKKSLCFPRSQGQR